MSSAPIVAASDVQALAACGDVLAAARPAAAFSRVLALVAGTGLVVAGAFADAPFAALALFSAALAAALAAQWLAFRVNLDAALFARLAAEARDGRLDLASLDAALGGLGLLPRDKAGRDVTARCRGALALVQKLGIAVVAQAALIVAGGLALTWSLA